MVVFVQLYKNTTDCLVLKVLTVSRFQNGICVASQEKENKARVRLIEWPYEFLKDSHPEGTTEIV